MSAIWTMAKVFKLSSVAGLVPWVDYIPVTTIASPAQPGTFENDGAIEVDIISSTTGLREWIDYIPVFEVVSTAPWTFDNDGSIRITQAGGGGGPTYAYALTVGDSNPNYGYVNGTYGSLSPTSAFGDTITELRSNVNTDRVILDFGSVQVPGITHIEVDIEGFGAVTTIFETADYRAQSVATAAAYIAAQAGNTIGINLTDVTP